MVSQLVSLSAAVAIGLGVLGLCQGGGFIGWFAIGLGILILQGDQEDRRRGRS